MCKYREGAVKFRLPVPGKADTIVVLPEDIDADDWKMLKIQLDAYVQRIVGSSGNGGGQKPTNTEYR